MASIEGNRTDDLGSPENLQPPEDDNQSEDSFMEKFSPGPPDLPGLIFSEESKDAEVKQMQTPKSDRKSSRSSIASPRKSEVPDGVEIIDLESMNDQPASHSNFIRLEDQGVQTPGSDQPASHSNLIRLKDKSNVTLDEHQIKKENDLQISTGRVLVSEVIEALNLDDGVNQPTSPQDESIAVVSQKDSNSFITKALNAPEQTSTSEIANPKAKFEMSSERILHLQKAFAERSIHREIPEYESSSMNDTEDEHAWMNAEDVDFDGDAAATFADLKSEFKKKKRSGGASWQDDVNFMKAESAETARLKRLETDSARARDPVYPEDINRDQNSDEDLFIPSEPKPSRKRTHQEMTEDDDEEDDDEEDDDEEDPGMPCEKPNRVQPMTKRRFDKEKATEEDACMMVGISDFLTKTKKQEAKKSKRKQGRRKTFGSMLKDSKLKDSKSRASKAPKRSRNSKFKSKVAKLRANQPGYLNDLGSLFNSNVYEDSNANLDRPEVAALPHTNKDKLLKALLAGVPLEDQREVRGQKTHILKSTRILGNVSADGQGRWKMKGMRSSLYHHQVQGAAWMRERENGVTEPRGGMQADQMGFGKTIMMLAAMVANPPLIDDPKPTLVVCNPALLTQWRTELYEWIEKGVFPNTIRYQASTIASFFGPECISGMEATNVIFTTYQEVVKSYPKFKPPKDMVLPDQKKAWWKKTFETERGLLHRIYFHRIVLDEAHAIKNHLSQTSIACRALMGKHRWAITGTPIQNAVAELYPYFKFLRVKHTGTLETFKENFCEPDDEDDQARLHTMLKQFMIRRTYRDRIFGAPIVKLPKNTQTTIKIEFNMVERIIYEAVRTRYINEINARSKAGTLEKSYNNVLTMLLRLRQLTAHPFMLQETIEDLFQVEDIQKLWESTTSEVSAEKDSARDMLSTMRKIIAEKLNPTASVFNDVLSTDILSSPSEDAVERDDQSENLTSLVFRFRKFLRELSNSSKWALLRDRSLCHRCMDPPDEPWVTDCMHVYCKECLNTMAYEAAQNGEEGANCLQCGNVFSESRSCNGVEELETGSKLETGSNPKTVRRIKKNPDDDIKWIDMDGKILPSSKTAAVQAQIEYWLNAEPEKKIIIFCQFHTLMKVLGKICNQQGWKHCSLHGKMKHTARDKAIQEFSTNSDIKVMIASLKCGGIGLNLTMASRVICVDLWWNSCIEQQAFCRILRIGQESETFITRLIVKNTVDEKLQDLQEAKSLAIGGAIDNPRMLEKRSLPELMELFGQVSEDGDRKPFIMVDDEGEFDSILHANLDNTGMPFPRN